MVGLTQVEPYKSPLLLQMVGDLLNGEVLDLEPASRHSRVRTPFLMPVNTETFCTDPPSPPAPDGWSCCLHLVRGRGVETREQVAEGFHVIGWPAR
jgi:hypothetical protein